MTEPSATPPPPSAPTLVPAGGHSGSQRVTVPPRIPVVIKRPRRRSFVVRFVGNLLVFLLVVGGIAGGGLYAKKVIDERNQISWSKDVQPLAEQVGRAHGLPAPDPVPVVEMDAASYSLSLAQSRLGLTAATVDNAAAEWRAMGLLQGKLDLRGVGATPAVARPAFYDRQTNEIHLLKALPATVRSRALASALVELLAWQQRDVTGENPAALAGATAVIDGDARLTAEELVPTVDPMTASTELSMLSASSPMSPYLVDRLGADAGTSSTAKLATTPDERGILISQRPSSDAVVLDAGRAASWAPSLVDDGAGSRGMAYWYYVLAGRIPSDQAWTAALAWNGDSVHTTMRDGNVCVSAEVRGVDEAGQALLLTALQQWADAGAPESQASVEQQSDSIQVFSCDPGESRETITAVGVDVFGSAPQELQLVASIGARTDSERLCAVQAVRAFGLAAKSRAGQQSDVDTVMVAIAQACNISPPAAPAAAPTVTSTTTP